MPSKPKPLKKRLNVNQFYCVSCRKPISCSAEDIKVGYFKNYKAPSGKVPVLKAKCSKCDCKVSKFVKRDKVAALKKKFN